MTRKVFSIRIDEDLQLQAATKAKAHGLSFSVAVEQALPLWIKKRTKSATPGRWVKCLGKNEQGKDCGHQWETKAKRPRCSKCKRTKVAEVKQKRKRA